jgi:hypothetical protein
MNTRIDPHHSALETIRLSLQASARRVDKCIKMAVVIAERNNIQGKEVEIAGMILSHSRHIGNPEIFQEMEAERSK